MDANGEETEKEENEEVEELRKEDDEEIYKSLAEESVEDNKKGRARQILPRQSKTNHRVITEVKDMKRGGTKKQH